MKTAYVILAGAALAVLIPVRCQAGGLVSGGASRELATATRTFSDTMRQMGTRTVTRQITDPTDVIEEEYLNLAIAIFDNDQDYCNVRSGPGTEYEVVGRMYNGCVGSLMSETDENIANDTDPDDDNDKWIRVRSGDVEGYISEEFLVTGVSAYNRLDSYTEYYADINVSQLNVRKEASINSQCLTYVKSGERYLIVTEDGVDPRVFLASREGSTEADKDDDGYTWIKIEYSQGRTGYVATEYITVSESYKNAKTIEEIRAEEEAEKERNRRANAATSGNGQAASENLSVTKPDLTTDYATVSDLRAAIVNYGLQFVGNPYVLGGRSLAGTDCSGFTCYVYRDFGYSISRTPSGQYASAGRMVSLEEAQPGDIICYGNGGCSHVAMYIGNGQIVQEANSRRGLEVNSVYFMRNIIGVKNVLD